MELQLWGSDVSQADFKSTGLLVRKCKSERMY